MCQVEGVAYRAVMLVNYKLEEFTQGCEIRLTVPGRRSFASNFGCAHTLQMSSPPSLIMRSFHAWILTCQLAGHASATISQERRVAVLTKVNKAYASLGKEDFPDTGKDIFGKGFESLLKERECTETAKAIHEAKKVGQQLFWPAPLCGRPYLARGGSWNNLRRGARQGHWQTRTCPFQLRGRGFLPPYEPNLNQPVNKGMSPNLLPINSAPAQVAGCLKFFQNNWHFILDDPSVLETITGYKIVFFYASPGSLASHFRVSSPTGGCPSRDRQNSSARSHPPILLQHRGGIRQQYISSRQEGRWPLPGYKPKESEFLCELPTFQNGGNSHVTGPVKKRGFHAQTGLKRRILYCPGLERASKILKVHLEENSMGICMSSIRAGNSSELGDSSYYISG